MQELIALRHAESTANRDEVLVWHTNASLSQTGIKQRNVLCHYLSSISLKIDNIFSSDLSRAIDTIRPYSDRAWISIQEDQRLREMHFWDFENTAFDDIDMRAYYRDKYWFVAPKGESYETMRPRVENFLDMLHGKYAWKRILISTHACVLRLIDGILLWKTPSEIVDLEIGNASLSHYVFSDTEIHQSRFACEEHFKQVA